MLTINVMIMDECTYTYAYIYDYVLIQNPTSSGLGVVAIDSISYANVMLVIIVRTLLVSVISYKYMLY